MAQSSRSQHSSRNGKGKAAPKIKTGARSARVRSSEEPTSPNPRPPKIARRSGAGMSRLEDILAGSSLGARASQEASAGRGRGRGARGSNSTRGAFTGMARKEKAKDATLTIDLDTIVVLPYGIVEPDSDSDSSMNLAYALPPNRTVDFSAGGISKLMQRGLCVIDHSAGFTFRASDTHSEVTTILRAALPRLFAYLDQAELETDDDSSDPETAFFSSWLVCTKRSYNNTTLDVFSDDVKSPDGTEIINAMIASAGKAKVAAKDRILFLTTRRCVPKSILDSWKPRSRRLGLSTHKSTVHKSSLSSGDSESEAESGTTTDSGDVNNEENDYHVQDDDEVGEVNNDEQEVGEIIAISSDDELPGPATRVTRAATIPVEERDDEAFLASFDFLNDPRNPHISRA